MHPSENPSASRRVSRRRVIQAGAIAAGSALSMDAGGNIVAQNSTPVVSARARLATSPQHGSRTAMPQTSIGFRGIDTHQLGVIRVEGSISGVHSGVMVDHPDGGGVSWLPDDWFEPGEYVEVSADIALTTAPNGALRFRIATPAARIDVAADTDPNVDADPKRFHRFVTRPDVTPPVISITTETSESTPGYIFLTPTTSDGTNGSLIIDDSGEPIWYTAPDLQSHGHLCLKLQEYRGQPVLTWWEGAKTQGYGFGHWVMANTAYEPIAYIQAGNGISGLDCHDLVITPVGTAISIAYNPIEWNLGTVGGSYRGSVADGVIQEIDIETGTVIWEWHSLDHVGVNESYQPLPKGDTVPWDYIHLNSASLDDDGRLLLSARHTHAGYKVDRATGDVIWRLNGKRSDYAMGVDTAFAYAHDVQRQPDGTISLFDNADNQDGVTGRTYSRALFLRLDDDAMTATKEREIIHETEILSMSQANVQRLPNGNIFIGWGSAPVFSEFDDANTMVYNGRFPVHVQSYRAYRHEWTGLPSAPPDVVVEMSATGRLTAYVSWNGATDVEQWRVLGGETPDDLLEIARVPKDGFETEIPLDQFARWIVVEAWDQARNTLGRSVPVTPRAS
jgi:hypothetical protein